MMGKCVLEPAEGEECSNHESSLSGRSSVLFSSCAGSLQCVKSKCLQRAVSVDDSKADVQPAADEDSPSEGKSKPDEDSGEKDGKGGLTTEAKLGLGIGIPSMILGVAAVLLAYKQVMLTERDSKRREGRREEIGLEGWEESEQL